MKTILWHTWEPGLSGFPKTSGGGTAWTKFLWSKLNDFGYDVYWFEPSSTSPLQPKWKPSVKIDIAVFCWRWKLPDEPQYAERNMVYERQNALITWCVINKIPFIVHDQDLKMTKYERVWMKENKAIIATPSLFPEEGEISLHYPNPYLHMESVSMPSSQLIYVGNDYERREQAIRFTNGFSEHVHTVFYGNWGDGGHNRSQEEFEKLFPHVVRGGRLPQEEIIPYLYRSKATILLHKKEYGPRGFMTIRWAEAAAAGILPFIPDEFQIPGHYKLLLQPLRVSDGSEMLRKYAQYGLISSEMKKQWIADFRTVVDDIMRYEKWLNLLEGISK